MAKSKDAPKDVQATPTMEVNPLVPDTIPQPLILTDAGLKIATKELACVANHIELTPDVAVTTLDTMCASTDYPGVVKWSLIATLYQSFDAGRHRGRAVRRGGGRRAGGVRGDAVPLAARQRDQPEVVRRADPAAVLADQR